MNGFFDAVQVWTEKRLTLRKAKIRAKKNKKKTFLSEFLDWLDAILFAVLVVLLINQYIFQLFVIPSPSMEDTLRVGDRIVSSKLTYGLEAYIQGPKILENRTPDRDDIITFYNPEYESKGTFYNLFSTMLYMGTFSLVNIDRNEDGSIREKLLIKRTGAVAGDTVKFVNGDAFLKASGTGEFVSEQEFKSQHGYETAFHRTIEESTYKARNAQAILEGISRMGVSSRLDNYPDYLISDYRELDSNAYFTDSYGFEQNMALGMKMADPSSESARSNWAIMNAGIYVPEGYILPLGDNRDNSADGRYFGPVETSSVNGMAFCTFWPLSRARSLVN